MDSEAQVLKFHRAQHRSARTILNMVEALGTREERCLLNTIWAKMATRMHEIDGMINKEVKHTISEINRVGEAYQNELSELLRVAENLQMEDMFDNM